MNSEDGAGVMVNLGLDTTNFQLMNGTTSFYEGMLKKYPADDVDPLPEEEKPKEE